MNKIIKILHLEDDDKDAMLIEQTINSELSSCKIKRVDSRHDFEYALTHEKFDLILSDFALPSFNGLEALKIAKELAINVPYIYVSGHIGEDRAIEALRMGATDYVLKDKIIKLLPAINRALKEAEEIEKNKNIEKRLRESEENFRTIVSNFPVVLFILNREGVATFSQGNGLETSGIKSEELIGKNIVALFNNVPFELLDGSIIRGKEAFLGALSGKVQNGIILFNDRYNDIKLLPYYGEDNKMIGVIGISHDITELINTRNQFKESEELYKNIFVSAPIGMARISTSGRYLSANFALQKMLDYSEDELRNLSIDDITFDDDKTRSKELFLNVISTKSGTINFEKRYISKMGNVFWVNLTSTVVKNNKGKVLYLLSMLENINDKKLAEFALRESEKRFKDLADLLPQTVFEVNNDTLVTYINKEGLKSFLYTEEDLKNGLTINQFLHSNDKELIIAKFYQVLNGEQFGGIEFIAIRKDGSEFPCLVYASSIIIDNKAEGLRGILIDITERKKTLEELVKAKENAEEMNRLKSYFLANMSHELRTPLIGILGYSDILKDELANSQSLEMIEAINTSGNRLLETLNLILDLSRIEADRLPVNYEPFEAIDCIKQVIIMLKNIADKKGLFLEINNVFDSIQVNLDERMFRQIIENLVNNAIKFTINGGVIVKIDKEENVENHLIIIKIIDTGIGIDKESQKLIFEEFRQASEGYSRRFQGTGLGLTITKHFIGKMNGSISLESEINKGSVFTIKLPINISLESNSNHNGKLNQSLFAMGENTKLLGEIPRKISRKEILLVEDDVIARTVTEIFLKKLYFIESVSNSSEAIQKVISKNYSAILMDINLGSKMNGIDTVKKIRELPYYKDIPIIAFTAYAMKGDKEKFLSSGFTYYLSKPFSKADLYNVLSEAFRKEK